MTAVIRPHRLSGTVRAIPSKSAAHRALILAALADKPCDIAISSVSEDVMRTADALCEIGAGIVFAGDTVRVTPIQTTPQSAVIDCGESGSTLRFMMCVCASLGISTEFICRGRLGLRPMGELRRVLEDHGIAFDGDHKISGRLCAGEYSIAGNVSSQYVTGLMLALGALGEASFIRLTSPLESAPYVELTKKMMDDFGCRVVTDEGVVIPASHYTSPEAYSVEGDWSAASFRLCAGCTVDGLTPESAQGDRRITDILREMGAEVSVGQKSASARFDSLHAITLDARDIPDLVPVIAALCATADGESRIRGVRRLKYKESDRIASVVDMINALGGDASATDDEIVIRGTVLRGGTVDGRGDHRIVMAAAVASCFCTDRVSISDAGSAAKSDPHFWEDFAALGGEVSFIS